MLFLPPQIFSSPKMEYKLRGSFFRRPRMDQYGKNTASFAVFYSLCFHYKRKQLESKMKIYYNK